MDKETRRQQDLAKQGVGFRAITRGPCLFPQVAALGQAGVVHTSLGKQEWSFYKWRLMGKQWWSSATLYKGSPFVGGGSWPSSASYIAAFGKQR